MGAGKAYCMLYDGVGWLHPTQDGTQRPLGCYGFRGEATDMRHLPKKGHVLRRVHSSLFPVRGFARYVLVSVLVLRTVCSQLIALRRSRSKEVKYPTSRICLLYLGPNPVPNSYFASFSARCRNGPLKEWSSCKPQNINFVGTAWNICNLNSPGISIPMGTIIYRRYVTSGLWCLPNWFQRMQIVSSLFVGNTGNLVSPTSLHVCYSALMLDVECFTYR